MKRADGRTNSSCRQIKLPPNTPIATIKKSEQKKESSPIEKSAKCKLASVDPLALNVSHAQGKQDQAETEEDYKIKRKSKRTVLIDGGLQYVCPVSKWKNIGEGPQKKR